MSVNHPLKSSLIIWSWGFTGHKDQVCDWKLPDDRPSSPSYRPHHITGVLQPRPWEWPKRVERADCISWPRLWVTRLLETKISWSQLLSSFKKKQQTKKTLSFHPHLSLLYIAPIPPKKSLEPGHSYKTCPTSYMISAQHDCKMPWNVKASCLRPLLIVHSKRSTLPAISSSSLYLSWHNDCSTWLIVLSMTQHVHLEFNVLNTDDKLPNHSPLSSQLSSCRPWYYNLQSRLVIYIQTSHNLHLK